MTAPARAADEAALRMRARAHLCTELVSGSPPRTRLSVLRSQAPLKLRPSIARGPEPWAPYAVEPARVCLAASGAGPMGGDDLSLDIEVGAGTTLLLTEASATLLLPGADAAQSRLTVRARVAPRATFVWMPEPVIAARGCHHVNDIAVDLASDARLVLREELLLGRRGEAPGAVDQRLRIRRQDRPLLAQDLALGRKSDHSAAIVAGHRAVGSMVVVDPELPVLEPRGLGGDGVLLPLAAGQAVLAQALADDSIDLRGQLDAALQELGPPWTPRVRHNGVVTDNEEAG